MHASTVPDKSVAGTCFPSKSYIMHLATLLQASLGGSFSSMHMFTVHCMQYNGDRYGKNPALLCRMHCVADDMCNNEVLFYVKLDHIYMRTSQKLANMQ